VGLAFSSKNLTRVVTSRSRSRWEAFELSKPAGNLDPTRERLAHQHAERCRQRLTAASRDIPKLFVAPDKFSGGAHGRRRATHRKTIA
jgi:hypothetical protein